MFFQQNGGHLPRYQMVGLPDFRSHSKSRLGLISDPHCIGLFYSSIQMLEMSEMLKSSEHWSIINKTGLQPVSRPVEQILGFFPKGFNAKKCLKNV